MSEEVIAERMVREWANFDESSPLTRNYADLVRRVDKLMGAVRAACVAELNQMRIEHEAAGTYPQGLGVFRQAAARLQALTLEDLDHAD